MSETLETTKSLYLECVLSMDIFKWQFPNCKFGGAFSKISKTTSAPSKYGAETQSIPQKGSNVSSEGEKTQTNGKNLST